MNNQLGGFFLLLFIISVFNILLYNYLFLRCIRYLIIILIHVFQKQ